MSLKKGLQAEQKAVEYLKNNDFYILQQNFHTQFGEIDIVAQRNNILHFVEVKSGNSFNPSYNLTERKMSRILKSVDIFIQNKDLEMDISIDLISIFNQDIDFLENISIF